MRDRPKPVLRFVIYKERERVAACADKSAARVEVMGFLQAGSAADRYIGLNSRAVR